MASIKDKVWGTLPTSVRRRLAPSSKTAKNREACPLPGGKLNRLNNGEIPHFCFPLEDPDWVTVDKASYLEEDDSILGFEIGGRHYAVAWDVMAGHHVANLVIDDEPYALTLCDACVGGGLYEANLDGRRLRFRVDGMYNATPYVIDQETGSFWTMVSMKPVGGPAVEHGPLHRLPMVHATWSEWSTMHPDTLVVHDPGEPLDGHGGDHRFPGHSHIPRFVALRTAPEDPRMGDLELVMGIEVGDAACAFPLDLLHGEGGLINHVVDGRAVAAVSIPGTYIATAFYREVDGKVLELDWDGGAAAALTQAEAGSSPLLVDVETGTRWDLFGNAVDGPLLGACLPFAWGGLEKWFNWSNLHVASELWSKDDALSAR